MYARLGCASCQAASAGTCASASTPDAPAPCTGPSAWGYVAVFVVGLLLARRG